MAKKDEEELQRYMTTFNKHDPFDADVIKFMEGIKNRSNFIRNLLLHYVWTKKTAVMLDQFMIMLQILKVLKRHMKKQMNHSAQKKKG